MRELLKELYDVYLTIIKAITPIAVSLLPLIPTLILDNGLYMAGLVISIPLGIVLMGRVWH